MTHDPALLNKLLLVGTARAQAGAAALPAELASVVQAALTAPGTPPERQVWLALGAQCLWTRAGYLPPPAAPAATSAPSAPEQLPACPAAAESLLKRLLDGAESPALLREWLRLLNRHQVRLPERFLPNMLARATQDASLRHDVQAGLGMRGRWLAQHEPDWSWACSGTGAGRAVDKLVDTWHNGRQDERVAALAAWRRTDPAAAREALQSGWAAEPPELRAALLPCLGIELGMADEPLLEAALDDRRKQVRMAAQDLLARLPQSALSQRMLARVSPLLQLEKRFLRGNRLTVALPQACDAAMARDGIGNVKHPGLGDKAGWLADMLAAVHPSHWLVQFALGPEDCLALATGHDYQDALLLGWTGALKRYLPQSPDAAPLGWLAAWTRAWLRVEGPLRHEHATAFMETYAALPAPLADAAMLDFVRESGSAWRGKDVPLVQLLHHLAESGATWPPALSFEIARRLLAGLPELSINQWTFRQALSVFAAALDPASVLEAERQWSGLADDPRGWREPVDTFFRIVRFRHEMVLSFQEHA